MSLKLVSISTVEPVSVDDLKMHLKISTAYIDEDPLLKSYITVSRSLAENYCKRQFVRATYRLKLDRFEDIIELPRPHLSSSSTDLVITYINSTSGTSTLATTVYTVDTNVEPSRVYLSYNQNWPTDVQNIRDCISIQYVCGYSSSTDAPEEVKTWIKMRAGVMYENREALVDSKISNPDRLPYSYVDGLLDPYVCIKA